MFSGESPRMWCPTVVSASDVTQHFNKVFQNLILMVSFDIVFYTQIMFGPANVKVKNRWVTLTIGSFTYLTLLEPPFWGLQFLEW